MTGHPSTRFKDLVDLVAIAQRATVPAALQMRALGKKAARRNIVLPEAFDIPDRAIWTRGYKSEARRTVGLEAMELDEALAIVREFLNPLLVGEAMGEWKQDLRMWS